MLSQLSPSAKCPAPPPLLPLPSPPPPAVTKAAKADDSLAQDFFCDEYQLDYAISGLPQQPLCRMFTHSAYVLCTSEVL